MGNSARCSTFRRGEVINGTSCLAKYSALDSNISLNVCFLHRDTTRCCIRSDPVWVILKPSLCRKSQSDQTTVSLPLSANWKSSSIEIFAFAHLNQYIAVHPSLDVQHVRHYVINRLDGTFSGSVSDCRDSQRIKADAFPLVCCEI